MGNLPFLVIVRAPQPKKENAYGWLHVATIGYDVAIGIISTFAALLASIQVKGSTKTISERNVFAIIQ